MSVIDIVDRLAEAIEPDESKRDDSRVRPRGGSEWLSDTLYMWARSETFLRPATGPQDEEHFNVRIAWCIDDTFARAGGAEDRSVSVAIAEKVLLIRSALLSVAGGGVFEDVHLDSVDYEALFTNERRGFYADASGYQLGS